MPLVVFVLNLNLLFRFIESDYDFTHFENKVECFPMEDHNPPKFLQIDQFCKSVQDWLDAEPNNVVAVHCESIFDWIKGL